jgi:hypothetical protein
MSILSAFNNLLDQFLNELTQTFPELTDLNTIRTLCGMLRSINPRMVLDNFLSVAGRYHKQILYRQSEFFENLSNWQSDPYFQSEFASQQQEVFQKLGAFKDIWVDLDDQNKNQIWIYFEKLLLLAAKGNKNPELEQVSQEIISIFINKNTLPR